MLKNCLKSDLIRSFWIKVISFSTWLEWERRLWLCWEYNRRHWRRDCCKSMCTTAWTTGLSSTEEILNVSTSWVRLILGKSLETVHVERELSRACQPIVRKLVWLKYLVPVLDCQNTKVAESHLSRPNLYLKGVNLESWVKYRKSNFKSTA